jgi:hypothetical protein
MPVLNNTIDEDKQEDDGYRPPAPEVIEFQIVTAMNRFFPLRNPVTIGIEIGGHAAAVRIGTDELVTIYRTWYERFFTDAPAEIEIEVSRHDVFEEGVFRDIHSGGHGDLAWIARWDFCALVDKKKRRVQALLRHDAPYFTTDAMLRIAFSTLLIDKGLLLIHGASVAVGARSLLLVGPSQSGKSTAARALAMDQEAQVFADDVTALIVTRSEVRAYSTPFWSLKESDFQVEKVRRRNEPLAFCASLVRGDRFQITPLSGPMIVLALLPNIIYFGVDAPGLQTVFDLAFRIGGLIPFFELSFLKDQSLLPPLRAQLGGLLP